MDYSGQRFNQYQLIEKLGQGGMATVYKAFDTRLERDVAIKVVRKESIPPEHLNRILKRFEREAKALAKFIHPHIVPVHDYGEFEGAPYLVMAYLPGGTLKEQIGKAVPVQQALNWVIPIASALSYAHQRGVIHRDVKPSNILITDDGTLMLSDFGIAQVLEETTTQLTATGMGVGTPEYMAPEQWQGKADAASDQYALGVVLYELLTGQKPYSAETPMAVALKVMSEPLPRPSTLVPEIPESVEKVLYKALARNPEDRYEDMCAFQKVLSGLQTQPQQATAPERTHARKTTQDTLAHAVQPTVESEGATLDVLEVPEVSSDRSDVQQPVKAGGEKKKKRVWLWRAGGWAVGLGLLIVLTLVIVLFWPKIVGKDNSVTLGSEGVVGGSSGTVPNSPEANTHITRSPTSMATAVPTPTVTQDLTFVIDQYLAEDFLDLSRSDYDYLRVVSASGVDHSKFDEDYYGIFVEDVEAGLRELISELSWKRDPKISPDGQKVAYIWWYDIEDDWNSNILITNIEDKETITIFGRGSAIEWSPDGRLLAVCDSYEDITIINLETEAKRSFDIRVSCEYFSWSPTGNKFVWLTRAGDHVNDDDGWMPLIYDIQTDHFLYIGDVEDNFGVYGPILWTKDGKHIIFESFELNTAGDRSNFQLMIADADGVQQEVLTQNVQVVDQRRFPWTKWVSPGEDIYFPH